MKVAQKSNALGVQRLQKLRMLWALGLLVGLLMLGCEKEPGKGGLATITGKVYGYDINQAGVVHDSGYAAGFKVYLAYGDNEWTDATENTSPEGGYVFQGLQKGDYRLWVFSECDTCLFNQRIFQQEVEITETRQVAVVPDFVILK